MTEFIAKYAVALFTFATAIVTTSIGYIYNYRLETKKLSFSIEKLKEEQKYKISESSYQRLFEKKIEVHIELHRKIINYKNYIERVGFYETDFSSSGERIEITQYQLGIELINSFNDYIKEQMFYVSESLEKKFLELISLLKKSDEIFDYEVQEGYLEHPHDEANEIRNKEFFDEHKIKIDNLIKEIEEEIRKIKRQINFD